MHIYIHTYIHKVIPASTRMKYICIYVHIYIYIYIYIYKDKSTHMLFSRLLERFLFIIPTSTRKRSKSHPKSPNQS